MDTKGVLECWIDAFNRHDVEGLTDLYAGDAINFQVAAEPTVGLDAIKADFEAFFHGFPDTYAIVENLMADGNWAAWEWKGGGTFSGEFLGQPPTGKSYELRGCGFFRIKNGKITLQRGYWDSKTWFGQIGLEIS